jgi:hypothetical protein
VCFVWLAILPSYFSKRGTYRQSAFHSREGCPGLPLVSPPGAYRAWPADLSTHLATCAVGMGTYVAMVGSSVVPVVQYISEFSHAVRWPDGSQATYRVRKRNALQLA